MKARIFLLFFALLSTSCMQHTVVTSGQQTVKSFIINPTNQWNLIPKQFSFAGLPAWTVDGGSLNSLIFISEISHGDTLLPSTNDKKLDTYDKDMLPNEIIEFIESTLLIYTDAKITNRGTLRPIKIGVDQGFEFEFEFVKNDEVPRKAYIAAASKNEMLHLILFQATKIHYYGHLIDDVKNIISSAVIKT